jgi:hypothetical protein
MLYEMATGEMAFGGDSEYEVMENIVNGRYQPAERRFDNIDPLLASVIRKALETDPADRFESCEEMARAIKGEIKIVAKPATAPAADKPAQTAVARTSEQPVGAVQAEPGQSSKKGLVIGLVVAALALGGGAIFLALNGEPSASSPTTDGSGSSAMAAAADAAVAMTAEADAGTLASVTPVTAGELDAGVAVAEVPRPVDAGVIAPRRVDAGVAVAVAPRRVDAGVVRKGDAAVVVASVPADAAVPAKPNPCAGNWTSGGELQCSFAPTGCSGSYKFTSSGGTCSGQLRGCRVQDSSVVATFSCKFSNTQNPLDGSMSIACVASFGRGQAKASLLQGNMATLDWQIARQ